MDIDTLIATELKLYVELCRLASQHDGNELLYRREAHRIFYHINELRATRVFSILEIDSSLPPIS